jgi:hypothetical protein
MSSVGAATHGESPVKRTETAESYQLVLPDSPDMPSVSIPANVDMDLTRHAETLFDYLEHKTPTPYRPALRKLLDDRFKPLVVALETKLTSGRTLEVLVMVHRWTGIAPVYLVLGGTAALVLILRRLIQVSAELIYDAMAFLYPAIKTMEHVALLHLPRTEAATEEDDIAVKNKSAQWCTYWLAFSALKMLDRLRPVTNMLPFFNSAVCFLQGSW